MTPQTPPIPTTPYPPIDEDVVKVHYWPEYVELTGADTFTNDYPDQFADEDGYDGPVGFHVLGRCPRCTCLTSDVFPLEVVGTGTVSRTIARGATRSEFGPEEQVQTPATAGSAPVTGKAFYGLLSCRCPTVHFPPPGAPDGSKPADAIGCGSFWMVAATPGPARTQMTIGPVGADVAYRAWSAARTAGESTPAALTTIQANAGKWQTSMTAVLGLLVVTGLVGGRTVLETLGTWWQIAIGLFAALSLVANVRSIFLLTDAASGRARLRPSGSLRQLEEADLEPLRQARWAEQQFGRALHRVVASFGAALVALLLVWLAPAAVTPTVDVTIQVGSAPRATCGAIIIDRGAGTFTVIPKDLADNAQTYPIATLNGIGPTC